MPVVVLVLVPVRTVRCAGERGTSLRIFRLFVVPDDRWVLWGWRREVAAMATAREGKRECERRMESAWSNGKAAYRCRHGHTTASARGPQRPRNAYVREDLIVAHLPALHLLLTGPAGRQRRRRTRRGIDVGYQAAGDVISYLREQQIVLIFDPASGTLRAGTGEAAQTITLIAS